MRVAESASETKLKLSFHGADRGVTGSCHFIECAGRRVLIDCGPYRGSRELDEENAEPFGFDPSTIDHSLLTHAHRRPTEKQILFECFTFADARTLCRSARIHMPMDVQNY